MKLNIGKVIKIVLGIDDTELPEKQIKYLSDIANTKKNKCINEEHLVVFIESLRDKHDLEEISIFRKGVVIFSSEKEELEKITNLYNFFEKSKAMFDKKLIMIKNSFWITLYEREGFTFVIKKWTKLNEVEVNAITYDVLTRLDKILLEERNIIANSYNLI